MSIAQSLVAIPMVFVAALAGACSDAETPNSGFTAPSDAGFLADSGPDIGGVNEPCADFRCDTADLICVLATNNDTGTCRALCDVDAGPDPCGLAFTCGRLLNTQTACIPAGAADEDCPCDEGLICIDVGGTSSCKYVCDPSADAGTSPDDAGAVSGGDAGFDGQGCPPPATCRPLALADGGTSTTNGACL